MNTAQQRRRVVSPNYHSNNTPTKQWYAKDWNSVKSPHKLSAKSTILQEIDNCCLKQAKLTFKQKRKRIVQAISSQTKLSQFMAPQEKADLESTQTHPQRVLNQSSPHDYTHSQRQIVENWFRKVEKSQTIKEVNQQSFQSSIHVFQDTVRSPADHKIQVITVRKKNIDKGVNTAPLIGQSCNQKKLSGVVYQFINQVLEGPKKKLTDDDIKFVGKLNWSGKQNQVERKDRGQSLRLRGSLLINKA